MKRHDFEEENKDRLIGWTDLCNYVEMFCRFSDRTQTLWMYVVSTYNGSKFKRLLSFVYRTNKNIVMLHSCALSCWFVVDWKFGTNRVF